MMGFASRELRAPIAQKYFRYGPLMMNSVKLFKFSFGEYWLKH